MSSSRSRLHTLKAEHPFWGYRRIWAQLRFVDGLRINKKRVLRLMRQHGRLVKATPAKSHAGPQQATPDGPKPVVGIDMTKVMVQPMGWVYVVIVLDWYTKKIIGHYAGLQAKSTHWLLALEQAVQRQFPAGVQGRGLSLKSDNGGQPTSVISMKTCAMLGITRRSRVTTTRKGTPTRNGSCGR